MPAKSVVYLQNFNTPETKGDRTKSAIAEAAATLLSEKGYGAMSFEQVARAMSLKRAHICYHFKDLEELEAGLFRWIGRNAQACVLEHFEKEQAAASGKPPLVAYVEGHLKWVLAYKHHHRAYANLIPQCAHSPELRAQFSAASSTAQDRIAAIAKLQRPDATKSRAEDIACLVYNSLIGIMIRTAQLKTEAEKSAEFARLMKSVEQVF